MQSHARQTVRVDDALLGLCNDAYVHAARRGAYEVGIADIAWCIAGSSRWARDIELAGSSARQLLAAAAAAQATGERERISGASGAPRTADELKILLTRAESVADRLGRTCATPGDFIHVLLLEADDLGSAAFVRSSIGQASGVRSDVPADPRSRTDARASGWGREERELARAAQIPKWQQNVPPDARQAFAPEHDMARVQRWPEPRQAKLRTRAEDDTESAAFQLGPNAIAERLSANETHLTALQRQSGGLAEQIAMLTAKVERLTADDPPGAMRQIKAAISAAETAYRREGAGLGSRLDAHERHLTELRRQILALSHEAETLAARLAQALEHGRTQAAALARVEQFAGSTIATSVAGRSRRGDRANRKAVRSRLRQIRRRHLRFRLRQRRRDRLRLRLRSDGRRVAWSQRAVPTLPVASRAMPVHSGGPVPIEAPADLGRPTTRLSSIDPSADLDEDISEPIEDEDDLELVGAFGERPKRFYLSLDDEVERAPSIGPRTAERLTAAGIVTVRDLLLCEPRDVASRVASRYVSVDRITAWQAQSRLVCTIPWLRGTHAQLLVGAGFDTLDSLVDADTSSVCAGILRFAATREGQSVLRSGPPPAAERVGKWMEHVTLAEPERVGLAA